MASDIQIGFMCRFGGLKRASKNVRDLTIHRLFSGGLEGFVNLQRILHKSNQHYSFTNYSITMSVQVSQAKQAARNIGRRIMWVILGVFLLLCIGYFSYSQLSFSDGYRSGQLVKISRRGMLFKTHEGTLNLSPNGMMTAWEFSVKNGKVSSDLQGLEGKQIRVHYEQRYQVFFWQGDTEYIVDGVEAVQ